MRIAVAQTCTGIDPVANADEIARLIARAADGGATMLFTPEMSNVVDRDRVRAAAVIVGEADDPVVLAASSAASAYGIWVQLGSVAVRGRGGAPLANRSLVIAPDGSVSARYDKMHLFDVDLADGTSWRESATYAAGDGPVVAMTSNGAIGLSICYDLRFPGLYQALSGAGATILSVPAAFTVQTGEAHWHTLLRARAIENACWLVAAAQAGDHADGRSTFGHSLVVDPWGRVQLDLGRAPTLGFCEISAEEVVRVRAAVPVLRHRRAIPPQPLTPARTIL